MGVGQTPVAVYDGIGASIQPVTSSVQVFYAQRQLKVTQTIYVAGTLELDRGDTITANGITYQVVGWRDLSGRGKAMAIDVEEWKS